MGNAAHPFIQSPAILAVRAMLLLGLALVLQVKGAQAEVATHELTARVVAAGIPGVAGIRQVGRFHAGGPIPGNPEFLMQTRPGRILDPERLLVTSSSNFGARPFNPALAAGAVLSLASQRAEPILVPATFAANGTQSSAANGAVQLFSAQSDAFVNRIHNRRARTADLPAVSGPTYISINNAFGRPWLSNAAGGRGGMGISSVLDPNGRPLDNAPSDAAGGVFASALTNRSEGQFTTGNLSGGAMGTAFMGPSPDASNFAVFAVVNADGSVAQVHVQDGVDGLAPPRTVTPLTLEANRDAGLIGIAFKWVPDRVLYVADRAANRIAKLRLTDDGRHFKLARVDYLTDAHLKGPVDLAPAIPEVANRRFASHTTLAGASDLFVLNREDDSIVRMTQDGKVVARARIVLPGGEALAGGRTRGLAVSADTQRIFVTLAGALNGQPGHTGAVIEMCAFDATGPFRQDRVLSASAMSAPAAADEAARGEQLFHKKFTPTEGLGPLYNASSCVECHSEPRAGGMSSREMHFALRVAHLHPVTGRVSALDERNSPIARRYSTRDLGDASAPRAGIPATANVVSMRMPTALYDIATLDSIPDEAILAHAVAKGDGIRGRPNRVTTASGEKKIGRYGWKADIASIDEMVAAAFANEIGITSPLAPDRRGTVAGSDTPKDDGSFIRAVVQYLHTLKMPERQAAK
jgi:hypothetical protein